MNWQMIAGLLRHVLTAAGGALIAGGVLDQSEATMLAEGIGGLLTLVGLGLSVWNKWGAKPAGAIKSLILIPFLALGLTACGSDPEVLRSDLEQKAANIETAVSLGSIASTMYAGLPDCGGTAVICKNPDVAVAIAEAVAIGKEALMDVRLALAEGLTDEERVGLIAAAVLDAVNRINAAIEKINAPAPEAPAA